MASMTQTAAMTSFTPAGGLLMVLTTAMSAGFKVFKAAVNSKRWLRDTLQQGHLSVHLADHLTGSPDTRTDRVFQSRHGFS